MVKKYRWFLLNFFLILSLLAMSGIAASPVFSDIIIDNSTSPGTTQTGTWSLSGGTAPYGADSLWSRNGATYTWHLDSQPSGTYEVLMWWSGYASRASTVEVTVNERNGARTVTIDQSTNAGRWNSLGTYYFDGTGSVRITAAYGDTLSTCADAVWFRFVSGNSPPTARIVSITPNLAQPGQTIAFEGQGMDPDGAIAAYLWESNIDGVLSESAAFNTSSLSEGIHTISLEVRDNSNAWSPPATETLVIGSPPQEIIIDNRDVATSSTGEWATSGASDPYGADSLWSRGGSTFTWHFQPVETASYVVSMWWTQWASRSTNVPVDIEHAGGTARVYINQQANGGLWNQLGSFIFQAGIGYKVTLYTPDPYPTSYCADAVQFRKATATSEKIIDNKSTDTASTGTWYVSGAPDPYGADSLYSRDGATFRWRFIPLETGAYTVSMWWTQWSSRSTAVPVDILHAGGTARLYVNQQANGGKWNSLGDYTFQAGTAYDVVLSAPDPYPTSYCADAVQFKKTTAVSEKIIDNGGTGTSSTGTWYVSSAPDPYGADSLIARDGATYTWTFEAEKAGYYQLDMWWTSAWSRSTNIPVAILYTGGSKTVYIDQSSNGGQWNGLGSYYFEPGSSYNIRITAQASPTSTCADAIRLRYVGDSPNNPPRAADDYAVADLDTPVTINILANDSDPDGTINSNSVVIVSQPVNGTASVTADGGIHYAPDSGYMGTDIFRYTVEDNRHVISNSASVRVSVGGTEEHIYYCPLYFSYEDEGIFRTTLLSMGAQQIQTNLLKYTSPLFNKVYWIHVVKDIPAMKQALKTQGAHLICAGHSNYGSGGVCDATDQERREETIYNLYYIDDDRLFNYSSPAFQISFSSLRRSHSWPNWWCIFKDGQYGLMPYDFTDPERDPAYNYYLAYQVPGDSTHYLIESPRYGAIERYPDCGRPAWYDASGLPPNSADTDHEQYFITNPGPWTPYFDPMGSWMQEKNLEGFYRENYHVTQAGTGTDLFTWKFTILQAGNYIINAWWPADSGNTADAPYTVHHASGSTTVRRDQRANGGQWNSLGQFYFSAGDYSVVLRDNADAGRVIADAIQIVNAGNGAVVKTMDNIEYPKYHYGSKTILFRRDLEIPKEELRYGRMIYDSCTSANYYLDTFSHGLVYFTTGGTDCRGINTYVTAYLEGKTDQEIWTALQNYHQIYDYYNFNKRPSNQ